jgi:hypothetical protein
VVGVGRRKKSKNEEMMVGKLIASFSELEGRSEKRRKWIWQG